MVFDDPPSPFLSVASLDPRVMGPAYGLLGAIWMLFFLVLIWARRADLKDVEAIGICPLDDNSPRDQFYYEVLVQTGLGRGSGTTSKVSAGYSNFPPVDTVVGPVVPALDSEARRRSSIPARVQSFCRLLLYKKTSNVFEYIQSGTTLTFFNKFMSFMNELLIKLMFHYPAYFPGFLPVLL